MTDYAAQPPQQPAARPGAGLAITALIFGILALLLFWTVVGGVVFGIIALILGPIASGRAKRGVSAGRGMAITGAILGLIGLIASVAIIVVGVSIFNHSGVKTFGQCIDDANGNQAKIDKCENQFRHRLENNH
jgi:hypothetical protein